MPEKNSTAESVFAKYEGLVYAQKLARRSEDLRSEATLALWLAALNIAKGNISKEHELPYILSCVNKGMLKYAIANSSLRLEREGRDERTSLSVYTDNQFVNETFDNYRHREVAHLLLDGYSTTQISKILHISPQATRLRIRGIKEVLRG
jgi:ATP/maltotriose-dependent transcriptional regulator MalT